MALIVQKYGGNLLSTPDKVKAIALKIKKHYDAGDQIVAVVSAMGKTTDELIELAYKVSAHPIRRELDMLLSVGERISMALLSMALNDLQVPAKSFTGSQSGILTERDHTQARIIDVKPIRIEKELSMKNVIIIAGFQGVSQEEKEITTLGRGGTDTTAVAMSYALKADHCEIMKDVGGIYSADPSIVVNAKRFGELNFETVLEATYWGAKILHFRAVELAQKLNIPIQVKHVQNQEITTTIHGDCKMIETQKILSVSSIKNVATVAFTGTLKDTFANIDGVLKKHALPWPQLLATETEGAITKLFLSSSDESLKVLLNALGEIKDLKNATDTHSTVTATGFGATSSDMSLQILEKLARVDIMPEKVIYTPQSVSVLVQKDQREKAIAALHELV